MQPIDISRIKRTYTTHIVPSSACFGFTDPVDPPQIGDLLVAEVVSLGKHTTIETESGQVINIFPGDLLIGAFGNRYATDQYEGYVPAQWPEICDLLSIGGVCGHVVSAHTAMASPTRLRILGALCDEHGQPQRLRSFGVTSPKMPRSGQTILVVGTAMNSGKTTTVGTLARALHRAGLQVAAAKITGTAAGKDGRYFVSCGAAPVFDFTVCGFPSTYMLSKEELLSIYDTCFNLLDATQPDIKIIEIADGIFQRETRMLLGNQLLRQQVDHVFFAANDSLGAVYGVQALRSIGWPVRAVSGVVTASPLCMREVEEMIDVPCLSIQEMVEGQTLLQLISAPHLLMRAAA